MWRILFIFLGFISQVLKAELPFEINNLIEKHKVNPDELSLWIRPLNATNNLITLNEKTPRNPASVTKLLTTSAALSALGEDYRWRLDFYVEKLPNPQGVLNGNLYIYSTAAPNFTDADLKSALSQLYQNGLREIKGDIVLDESRYYLNAQERDGASFDGMAMAEYNAIPHPFMINERKIEIKLDGKKNIKLRPRIQSWKIVNQLNYTSKPCKLANLAISPRLERDESGRAQLIIKGNMPKSCPEQNIPLVLGEGAEVFYYWFNDLWREIGGKMQGKGQLKALPPELKLFHRYYSSSLQEALIPINQNSNNVMTRQLMLSLGEHNTNLENARRKLLENLQFLGINTAGMVIDNGSGLSRLTQVSAEQIGNLLLKMQGNQAFFRSLAIAGEAGTLKKRFRGESLQGRLFGKTGTIKGVRSFAGYLQTQSGIWYAVVIIGNGETASASRLLQDDIFRWLDEQ